MTTKKEEICIKEIDFPDFISLDFVDDRCDTDRGTCGSAYWVLSFKDENIEYQIALDANEIFALKKAINKFEFEGEESE